MAAATADDRGARAVGAIQGRIGKGVLLDARASGVLPTMKPPSPPGERAAMPKHILCADDSVTIQKVVSITFAHTDYQVTGARSADEALALAQRQRPDLVLADALMPGRTGYDLCQALKSDPALRGVPVVILCGNSQAYDEARGKQVGADAFLTKPWDTQIFIDKVGEILARTAQHGVAQLSTATPIPAARPASVPPPPAPPRPAPPLGGLG